MCVACKLDQNKSEAFAQKLIGTYNSAALALMISVGHRTGLFDQMSTMEPATSHEIAARTKLDERYVREWLGAMVTGRVIECDPAGPTYHLPAEHAHFLRRASGPENMAVFSQYIAVLGSVEDQVVECFHKGGGVPYSAYRRFHEVMAEDSGQNVRAALLDKVLPIVPEIKERLAAGIDVLDIGCGSGRALNLLARTFPNSRFVGYDLSAQALERARAEAEGLTNLRFEQRDLTAFDQEGPVARFDLVTAFDAIHDQARPDRVLAGIARALRPDGSFLMQDIGGSSHVHENIPHPFGTVLYTISCMHCMTVSLAQGGLGLGAMWGKQLAESMLRAAGFDAIERQDLPHDPLNTYFVSRKSVEKGVAAA